MNNEQLSDRWDSIAKVLSSVIKIVDNLPGREQDSDFNECLESAFCHAEKRADALIDPS